MGRFISLARHTKGMNLFITDSCMGKSLRSPPERWIGEGCFPGDGAAGTKANSCEAAGSMDQRASTAPGPVWGDRCCSQKASSIEVEQHPVCSAHLKEEAEGVRYGVMGVNPCGIRTSFELLTEVRASLEV